MKLKVKEMECLLAEKALWSKEAAELCDMSLSTFSRAVKGHEISPRTAGKIARGFDINVHEIIEN